jgi:hypothetical protein
VIRSILVRTAVLVAALTAGRVPYAAAQTAVLAPVEQLSFDRPEAWAMKYFTSVTLLSGLRVPDAAPAGTVLIGAELGWVPHLSTDQQRVGFFGATPDDLNKAPILIRPQLALTLPSQLTLTIAGVPPIPAFGETAKLLAAAVQRPFYRRAEWTLGWRAIGQIGTTRSAFTCSSAMVAQGLDVPGNPQGCVATSSDVASLRYIGAAIEAGRQASGSRFAPHASVGVNYMSGTFQVNAVTDQYIDRTRLEARGLTFSATTGLEYRLNDRLSVSGDLFYTPLIVQRSPNVPRGLDGFFNARALVTYRVH